MDYCTTEHAPGYHHWASTTSSPAAGGSSRQQSPASVASPASDFLGLPDHLHAGAGPSPYPCMPLLPTQAASPLQTSGTPTRSRRERQKMALALAKRPCIRPQLSKIPSPPQVETPFRRSSSSVVGEVTGYGTEHFTTGTNAPGSPVTTRLPSPDMCPMGEGPFCACCHSSTPGDGSVRPQDLQYWSGREKMDSQRECHPRQWGVNRD